MYVIILVIGYSGESSPELIVIYALCLSPMNESKIVHHTGQTIWCVYLTTSDSVMEVMDDQYYKYKSEYNTVYPFCYNYLNSEHIVHMPFIV